MFWKRCNLTGSSCKLSTISGLLVACSIKAAGQLPSEVVELRV
jgi:hypothetical protein